MNGGGSIMFVVYQFQIQSQSVVSIDLFLISFMPFSYNGVYFASLTDAFLPTPLFHPPTL